MTEAQKQQIMELREKGFVFADIAKELGISVNSVKSFYRRHTCTAPAETPHSENLCKQCGAELVNTPGHRQKIFCSPVCRQKYWLEHGEQMQHNSLVTINCPVCGRAFSDYKGHHRKYCSHACYISHRYGGAAYESE